MNGVLSGCALAGLIGSFGAVVKHFIESEGLAFNRVYGAAAVAGRLEYWEGLTDIIRERDFLAGAQFQA